MARKEYPFNKRNLKFGTDLISNMLSFFIVSPLLFASSNGSSSETSLGSSEPEYMLLKPFKLEITHFICGLFFLLGPLLFIFIINLGCWVLFSFLITVVYELLFALPLIGFFDKLNTYYIFNSFDLTKQIRACKFVLNLWFIIFCIHAVFYTLYHIVFFWYLVNYDLHRNYWEYNISYELHVFLDNIIDVFSITVVLMLFFYVINIIMAIHFMKGQRDLTKVLSSNPSICKISKCSKKVDNDILCELYEREDKNDKLIFTNGGYLTTIKETDILNCGFILTNRAGKKKFFYFHDYANTCTELIQNGNIILKNMSNAINQKLKQYDVDYTINTSEFPNYKKISDKNERVSLN